MAEDSNTRFLLASREQLPAIVALLVDDKLGSSREIAGDELDERYVAAFDAIQADPNNELIVAEQGATVVGTLQITYVPNLTHKGTTRATIEGVRVNSTSRSSGIGTGMLDWTIDRCRERGCGLVQLTSDLERVEAIDFYRSLGFEHSHAGLKLWL